PPPLPVRVDGEEEWQVEETLDAKVIRNYLQYLVCWKVYDEATWELTTMINGLQAIDDFHI
ncbi:hypothetical protein L873DRAFT_1713942, partial [Choiromyces venosus 120613-1]